MNNQIRRIIQWKPKLQFISLNRRMPRTINSLMGNTLFHVTLASAAFHFTAPAFAADACDRQNLAIQILNNSRIILNMSHPSGVQDSAYARLNIIDTANGDMAYRSNYGTAPGGSTYLDPRVLDCMLKLAETYTFGVTEISGADHSVGSRHYSGLAFDVYSINGVAVNANNPHVSGFIQICDNMGARLAFLENNNHIHADWNDDGGNVACPLQANPLASMEIKRTWNTQDPDEFLILLTYTNVRQDGPLLKADLKVSNLRNTWIIVEQDLNPISGGIVAVTLPYPIYLLGPFAEKDFGTIAFPARSQLHLTAFSAIGLPQPLLDAKSRAVYGALAVDLMMRGLFSTELPPSAFDQPSMIASALVDPLLDGIISECAGPIGDLAKAILDRDSVSVQSALAAFALSTRRIRETIVELLKKYSSPGQVASYVGWVSKNLGDLVNLPQRFQLLRQLRDATFAAPPSSWVRLEVASNLRIVAVNPRSLVTLPLPRTQKITVIGSGFTSSSRLEFSNSRESAILSDPVRLHLINSERIDYDIRVGDDEDTWQVRVVNNSEKSNSLPFNVRGAQDTTAPQAPIGLRATSSDWSSNSQVRIDWTNPSDPSGIAKSWVKIGATPASSADGVAYPLPANKPLVVNVPISSGTRTVHVWLEDGAGNRDSANRASLTLGVDSVAPVIRILVPATSLITTTQDSVVLSGEYSDDLSGVVSVRWGLASVGSGDAILDGSSQSGNWTTAPISLEPGLNIIAVTATDRAGNIASSFRTVNRATEANSGTLGVGIQPQAAVDAGAQWRLAGETAWRAPNIAVSGIPTGNQVVEFKAVDGWITPLPATINVIANVTVVLDPSFGTYGSSTVTLAPDVPSNPYPPNGEANVSRSGLTLTWSGSHPTGSPDFAVKFGTENPPLFRAGFGTVAGRAYNPAAIEPLLPGTTYYWGVRAKVGDLSTDSQVWRFTTEYSYADLIPHEIVVDGNVEPGARVTVHVKVKNQGTFSSSASCWLNLYLSREPRGREQRISQINSLSVPVLAPGAEAELEQSVTLANLAVGQSFIDAWVDSARYGVNENGYENNVQSLAINYIDGKNPVVTEARLQNPSFVKTGQPNSIVYFAQDDIGIQTIDFYFSTNEGLDWTPIEEGHVPATPPAHGVIYPWAIPQDLPAGSDLYVRVEARDTSGNSGEFQAGPYLIRSGTAPTITVLSPNGGEVWNMGSEHEIRWDVSAPNGVGQFRVYFHRDSIIDFISVPVPAGSGTFTWTLPTPLSTLNGKIRISVTDLNGNTAEDYSDERFSVRDTSAPPPAPWTDPAIVTENAANEPIESPRIATDATGNVHLAYLSTIDAGSDPRIVTQTIRYKKRTGSVWSSSQTAYSVVQQTDGNLNGYYSLGGLGIDVSDSGSPHLVWTASYSGFSELNKADVFYASSTGSVWSEPQNLSQTILGGFPTTTLSWEARRDCPSSGVEEGAVANDKLYVFVGGAATYEYNPTNDQWNTKTGAPGGVSGYEAAEANGLIYVLDNTGRTIQIYNPANDSWSTGASIRTQRTGMSIVAVGGKVYAIGGSSSPTVEEYDPQSNRWAQKRDMPTARQYAAAAVVNGKIYVIGGRSANGTELSTVEVYDPQDDTWTVVSKPLVATWPVREQAVAVTLNNRIYLMGGRIGNTYLATVDEFDPATSAWQPMNPMTMPRGMAVAGVIQSQIVIVGGFNDSGQIGSTEIATITGTVNGAISGAPSIAVDSNDKVHVAWQDGSYLQPDANSPLGFAFVGHSDVYVAAKPSGQGWSSPSRLTTGSGRSAALAVGGANFLHLAYVTGNAIGYRQWDGTNWSGEEIAVADSNVQFNSPRLVSNMNNQLHLVWDSYDQSTTSEGIDYSYFDGTAWSAGESVAGPGSVNNPTIGFDSFNRPHVTWEDWTNPPKIYHSGKIGGLWSPRTQLNRDAQLVKNYSSGAALFTSGNELHVVWNAWVNGNTEVLYNHANVGSTADVFASSVSVTAPASNAILPIGSSFQIQWEAKDNVGVTAVSIDYNTNSENSWEPIAADQAASGTYGWLVPSDLGGAVGQIRVSARDAEENVGYGYSGTFTTADLTPPAIADISPDLNTVLAAGTTASIQWTATDNVGVTRINLDLSLNNGVSWNSLVRELGNSGSFDWDVPNSPTSVALIRVTAHDGAGLVASETTEPLTITRANEAPVTPHSPFPLSGALEVPKSAAALRWRTADLDGDSLSHEVRFGTSANPPVVASGNETSFSPADLAYGTEYFWRIDVSDGKATTQGPLWSFTTAIRRPFRISGKVEYYSAAAGVPGTAVSLSGDESDTVTAANEGNFTLEPNAGGTYEVTLNKTADAAPNRGVTTFDIALIRRHILGIRKLDSPYKVLAGDVNDSGSVTALDIAFIRQLVLALRHDFPGGLWRFVRSDFAFGDPQNPWLFESRRIYSGVGSDMANQDFIGVKLGDVDGSWTPVSSVSSASFENRSIPTVKSLNAPPDVLVPRALAAEPVVRIAIGRASQRGGGLVEIPIRARTAQDLTTLQFTAEWDVRRYRYVRIGDTGLSGFDGENIGKAWASAGKLPISWDSPDGKGVSVPEGASLFSVLLEPLGGETFGMPIRISDEPTVREASVDFELAELRIENEWPDDDEPIAPSIRLSAEVARAEVVLHVQTIQLENGD